MKLGFCFFVGVLFRFLLFGSESENCDLSPSEFFTAEINIDKTLNQIPLFDNFVYYKIFEHSLSNKVLQVANQSNHQYILKIFEFQKLEEVEKEYELVKKIQKVGIQVPETILKPTVVDDHVVWVTEFIESSHAGELEFLAASKLIAKLHKHTLQNNNIIQQKTKVDSFLNLCREWEKSCIAEELLQSLDLSFLEKLPQALIHGDYCFANVLVNLHGDLILIDFDFVRYGTPFDDIMNYLLFYAFDEQDHFKNLLFDQFTSAYESIRPFDQIERAHILEYFEYYLIYKALRLYYYMFVNRQANPQLHDAILYKKENEHLKPEVLLNRAFSLSKYIHSKN